MIACCVVRTSTWDMVEEVYLSKEYGYEMKFMPSDERQPTSLKSIYTTLKMSRETARRKVVKIVAGGTLIKVKGGYVFPAQTEDNDLPREVRRAIVENAEHFIEYANRVRPS
jgi:hypothetical protein